MKLQVVTTSIQRDGVLEDLYFNKTVGRFDLIGQTDNGNTIITGDIDFEIGELSSILNAGGEVFEYLMVIEADKEILNDILVEGMPSEKDALGDQKTIKNWFDSTVELYINAVDIATATKIAFFTNPIGTTKNLYLTATQIRYFLLAYRSTSPTIANRACAVRTMKQFQAESGWTRIN